MKTTKGKTKKKAKASRPFPTLNNLEDLFKACCEWEAERLNLKACTYRELAKRWGVSEMSISQWRRGVRQLSIDRLLYLANRYGKSEKEIWPLLLRGYY